MIFYSLFTFVTSKPAYDTLRHRSFSLVLSDLLSRVVRHSDLVRIGWYSDNYFYEI